MKQLKLKRISDERLMDIEEDVEDAVFCGAETPIKAKAGADAQLQDDQQVLDNVKQAIFDEIEHHDEPLPHKPKAEALFWSFIHERIGKP